jgi:hypothetical protein
LSECRTHVLPYRSLDALEPQTWEGLEPFSLDHYLWTDNKCAPEVQVKLYYTEERLHARFKVFEDNPLIRYYNPNEPVYRDSCVEFFLQPLPDSDPRYLNFEFNAAGTLLLEIGENRNGRRTLCESERAELFGIRAEAGLQTELLDDGPEVGLTAPDSCRKYWELEFSIPFGWLRTMFPDFLPEAGCSFRGNFFKCGEDMLHPHYGTWNRVTSASPDFHRSCDFGILVLG